MITSIFPQGIDIFPNYTNSHNYGTITTLENINTTQNLIKVEFNVPVNSIITNAWWTINSEILWLNEVVVQGSDTFFNVNRGQLGTQANAHLAGSVIRMPYLAEHYLKIINAITNIQTFLINGLTTDVDITSNTFDINLTGKIGFIYSVSIMIKNSTDYLTREYVIHHSQTFDPTYFEGYIFGSLNASISILDLTKNNDNFIIRIQNANNCQAKIFIRYLGGIF